jgi:hypothetical protein
MQPSPSPNPHSYDLDEYKQLTALFQSYLSLAVTTLNYTLLLAGGSTAYVLNQKEPKDPMAPYGLLVPAFICFAIGLGFWQAIPSSKELTVALQAIKVRLNLEIAPHTENLTKTLSWSSGLLLVMGVGIFVLFVWV